MTDTATSCRKEALLVRAQAAETLSPVVKQRLEGIASSYDVLAHFLDVIDTNDAASAASSAAEDPSPSIPDPLHG